ncbi:TPA: DUF1474 family protein [Staphylococcus aureus]|nr:DUF1474 family protein [Staphylococcus aureus]HCQ3493656.1 DUF1474 family protein [Staphylococcus aureus]
MSWELSDLFSDLKVLKDKMEDLKDKHGWHFDSHYPHETKYVLNKDDVIREGLSYHERRIYNNQMFDLLLLYTKEFDGIIEKFHDIEKASSSTDQSKDNA